MNSFRILLTSALIIAMNMQTMADPLNVASNGQSQSEYLPMFEIGKEWRYQLYWTEEPDAATPNCTRTLKVDGTKAIDGMTYYIVNAYTNNTNTPDQTGPYGYFREDLEARKVYFKPNKDYDFAPVRYHALYFYFTESMGSYLDEEEICLYDFSNKQAFDFRYSGSGTFNETFDVPSKLGALNAYGNSGSYSTLCMVEGIGYLPTDPHGVPMENEACDLLGEACSLPTLGMGYVTLLYSVVDGNGNEILSIDGNRLAGTEAVAADRNGSSITITADRNELRITAPFPIGDVEVFNPEGKHVYHGSFSETQATVSTAGFPPGIYMVKACGSVKKTRIAR